MNDNTQRFNNRVDNYVKYRPSYPTEIINFLIEIIGFNKDFSVADIGCGTGILSQLFLENQNTVFGVEPNEPMRKKAEELLKEYSNFYSVDGTAEHTTLKDNSINIITAAQAFHWFDATKTKTEFKRILQPNGYCCLIWNERLNDSPFAKAYDNLLLEYSTDYAKVDHKNIDDTKIEAFFSPDNIIKKSSTNQQVFDFEGLKGRLLSSSYAPVENHPNHNKMIEALKDIFQSFNKNNTVQFDYETKLYVGQLL